ncbi:uncharacterized protein LOC135693151 [Rhopilema esculentum]|uniref:uncharacterized protein LOC135693151 n=1 Tax=Rhopilema esculentum TaxID=499914 RepID=UPI0031DA95B4
MKLIMEKLQLTNISRVEEEILETLVDRGRRSLVHFGMLAEALNVDIKCHSVNNDFSCTYKSGNAWAEVDVLWYFGEEGQCHVYPLNELPEKIQQLCLAYDCAGHFGCSTGDDSFYCPFCCQTYHRKCLGKIYDNCCDCHALAKVLPVKSRLSQGDSIKRMLQNGTSMLEILAYLVGGQELITPVRACEILEKTSRLHQDP